MIDAWDISCRLYANVCLLLLQACTCSTIRSTELMTMCFLRAHSACNIRRLLCLRSRAEETYRPLCSRAKLRKRKGCLVMHARDVLGIAKP